MSWEAYAARPESRVIVLAELHLIKLDGTEAVLKVANRPYVDDTDVYWEHNLESFPRFSRRLRELEYGLSQVGNGNLILNNMEAAFDEYAGPDWIWSGRDVVVKIGFQGLPTAEFKTAFSGIMDRPSFTDDAVTIPVYDLQKRLLNAKLPEGTYQVKLPAFVQTCLDAAGITNKDATAWASWEAENNFDIYYKADGNTDVGKALDDALAPLCCWYDFDREKVFRVGTFTLAQPADVPALTLSDIEIFSDTVRYLAQAWQVEVEYISAAPDTTAKVETHDDNIQKKNASASHMQKRTVLTAKADAEIVRDRWWSIFSQRRRVIPVTAAVQPLATEMHDVIALDRPRLGLAGNFRVYGFTENITDREVVVELFG